jgi:hypothetical protein
VLLNDDGVADWPEGATATLALPVNNKKQDSGSERTDAES